jgi:DNA primase
MADFDLSREVVSRVRDAADLVEVAQDHVRLKKRGRTWEGLCPFHDEKTPSFTIDQDKGLYYCFGCHAGGDVFKFVMELETLSFPEAVERLARRFGVHLPAASPEARSRRDRSERLRGILEEAQHWFQARLASADGAAARAELERRGFERGTWTTFGFGWAPDDWRELVSDLSRSHPEGALVDAGLAVRPDSGRSPYDRFRKRVMFPIRSGDGRLVAFGGRILGDGEPKYLNSPESPLFTKRSTLFCLDLARRPISDRGEAVVVEGYFDCLSLHRVGVTHAVATLGTALTADHARLLRRRLGSDGRVILCYDADSAGRRAAAAGSRVVLEAGLRVAVLVLPAGSDPDDIVRSSGAAGFDELLDRPTSLVEFLLADLPEDAARRRRLAAAVSEVVAVAQDPHTRDEMFFELSRRVGLSQEVLRDLARAAGRTRVEAPLARSTGAPALPSGETMLVRILLDAGPHWCRRVLELVDPAARPDPRVGRLLRCLREGLDGGAAEDPLAYLRNAVRDEELDVLVAEVATRGGPELTDDTVRRQLEIVLREQSRAEATRLNEAIRQAEEADDLERVAELQRRKAELRNRRPDV